MNKAIVTPAWNSTEQLLHPWLQLIQRI